jgi:glycosyltransferase involved in cell wall biosynthesis
MRALAPTPTKVVQTSHQFIVVGYLRTCSGLGESARLCYDALKTNWASVAGIDLSAAMIQDNKRADFEFEDGSQIVGPGTIILHVNAPWIPFALFLLGRRLIRGKRIVGFWHWELPEVPKDWSVGYRFVHEIWVPTHFVAQAVSKGNPKKIVRIIPHPVSLRVPSCKAKKTDPDGPFVVLNVFNMISGFARKNPVAAVEAFRSAFGSDSGVRLIIKVTNSQLYPPGFKALLAATGEANNIEILTHQFSAAEMNALYERADVVVSLHRSEGFGLVIAEAMLHALPVIATDWSGNCDFLNKSNGMPVRWTLVPSADLQGEYDLGELSWADPDVSEASAKLIALRRDHCLRSTLGRRAREDAAARFSAENYTNAVAAILAEGWSARS